MKQIQTNTAGRRRIKSDELLSQQSSDSLRQSLPAELGEGHSALFRLDPDLDYIETHYRPAQDLGILTRIDSQEPRLVVTLGIKGKSRFVDKQGQEIVFSQGYTSISAFNSSIGERQYQADKPMAQLRFSMTKAWLERYFGENATARVFNKTGVHLLSYRPISNQSLISARQLLSRNIEPSIKRLFMHGQAMSILAGELGHLWRDHPESPLHTNQKDKLNADTARTILINEFKNPPSVAELAKRVGVNQFKLKQLFHHYFNNTPYGVLLDIRMNSAYQLLESSGCPIDVAADFVGYNHASNFSAAFSKYFGISPGQIAKHNKPKP